MATPTSPNTTPATLVTVSRSSGRNTAATGMTISGTGAVSTAASDESALPSAHGDEAERQRDAEETQAGEADVGTPVTGQALARGEDDHGQHQRADQQPVADQGEAVAARH